MTEATKIRRCWNDEAMRAMTTRMRTPWQDFCQTTRRLQDEVSQAIEDSFDNAIAQCTWPNLPVPSQSADGAVGTPPGLPTNSLRTLTATLRHRQAMLVTQVEDAYDEFDNGVS
jgi:hypothetical protein